MAEETTERRPFHEVIVDVIRGAHPNEMPQLGFIIKRTKIPEGHDAILTAWKQRTQHWSELGRDPGDFGVVADLLEQKKEAEEKAAAKETVSS